MYIMIGMWSSNKMTRRLDCSLFGLYGYDNDNEIEIILLTTQENKDYALMFKVYFRP